MQTLCRPPAEQIEGFDCNIKLSQVENRLLAEATVRPVTLLHLFPTPTPVARELPSTHNYISRSFYTLFTSFRIFLWHSVSFTICLRVMSSTWSSYPFVTLFARRLLDPVDARSYPHTGRCSTSFPHREKTSSGL